MDDRSRAPARPRVTAAVPVTPASAMPASPTPASPAVLGAGSANGNGAPPVTTAAGAGAAGSKSSAPSPPSPESSIKETLESILVAFILAFIFRAFVVEAFVIPTGSMAPTLLGAHIRFTCPDCGYRFQVNFNARDASNNEIAIPSRAGPEVIETKDASGKVISRQVRNKVYNALCPNCGYQVPAPDATNPEVHYGDRILVLKYLYLFQDPRRWDVVVFKSPDLPQGAKRETYDYAQNYIKRLVGRPNESILVLDGDVYRADRDAEQLEQFVVQTKPRFAQDALWRVVYDNDYHPRGLDRGLGERWEQPWQPRDGAAGWNLTAAAGGRVFAFDDPDGAATLYFNDEVNPIDLDHRANRALKRAFTDWLAYDVDQGYRRSTVSDLKLQFQYQRTSGDGPLRLLLSKLDHEFVAELTPSEARLTHVLPDGTRQPVGQPAALPGGAGGTVEVEFQNVDYQVTLRVGGRVVAQTTSDEYRPDMPRLLAAYKDGDPLPSPRVEITAERQRARLAHLSLWRDVYYLNQHPTGRALPWASPEQFPKNVARLGDGEYFVLGDNSLISGDARYWESPIVIPDEQLDIDAGRVPDRFMLGKAFFVYWPAGYKPAPFAPALTPNFGEMRFIR
jgi:signal peptidase I